MCRAVYISETMPGTSGRITAHVRATPESLGGRYRFGKVCGRNAWRLCLKKDIALSDRAFRRGFDHASKGTCKSLRHKVLGDASNAYLTKEKKGKAGSLEPDQARPDVSHCFLKCLPTPSPAMEADAANQLAGPIKVTVPFGASGNAIDR